MRVILIVMLSLSGWGHSNPPIAQDKYAKLEEKADLELGYDGDKLSMDIGTTNEKGFHFVRMVHFNFKDRKRFFDEQRQKDLIEITVAKNGWSDKKLKQEVYKLKDYFVARGYKRIYIQQAGGAATWELLDHRESKK